MVRPVSELPAPVDEHRTRRWQAIRDLLVFQLKIFLDGLKDVVLAPVGLVAGIVGLLGSRGHPGRYLYKVMRWGKRYEDWIALYGALEHRKRLGEGEADGLDGYVQRLERAIAAQTREGGMTTRARAAIEKALDALGETDDPKATQDLEKSRRPTAPDDG